MYIHTCICICMPCVHSRGQKLRSTPQRKEGHHYYCPNRHGHRATMALEHDTTRTWHVVHDHVEIVGILEGVMQLHNPFRVGMCHDVPLLPEKGRVRSLNHLKFGEKFHGVDSVVLFHANLRSWWKNVWVWVSDSVCACVIDREATGRRGERR